MVAAEEPQAPAGGSWRRD